MGVIPLSYIIMPASEMNQPLLLPPATGCLMELHPQPERAPAYHDESIQASCSAGYTVQLLAPRSWRSIFSHFALDAKAHGSFR